MPYILEPMTSADVPEVARIERRCFSLPWPTSAYKRELKSPETNRYIVVKHVTPELARDSGLAPPEAKTLTSLVHPELARISNGHETSAQEEVSGRSFLASLLPWWRNGSSHAVVAGPALPVVGYAGVWLMVDEAHVTTIGVDPDHRGQGAGELLFLGLVDVAKEMRATRLTLEVRVSNTSAQALYRKYGLEIAGLRKRYYSDNGEDAYIMWSEPIRSAEFKNRVSRLRVELAERLQGSFFQETAPSRPVDSSRLQ